MLVWYAAFGSNVLRERFLMYLRGGPVPGSGRMQHGARDATDPVDSRPYPLDRPMGFGFESAGWGGGGVAFVDPHRELPGDTMARAWLITDEQLADVWAQENGQTVGPEIDLAVLAAEGSADLGRGWYRRLEYLGTLDDRPVATITCEAVPAPNPAGHAYLDIVGRGLMETWSLSAADAAAYLASRNGNDGHVDRDSLADVLRVGLGETGAR